MDLFEIIDFLIPVVLAFYGFRWLTATPEFGSQKGITTKQARASEENWILAHKFGGKLSIVFAVIMMLIAIGKRFVTDESLIDVVTIVTVVLNLVLIFSLIPLINLYVKKNSK